MKTIKAFLARDLDGNLCIYFNEKVNMGFEFMEENGGISQLLLED